MESTEEPSEAGRDEDGPEDRLARDDRNVHVAGRGDVFASGSVVGFADYFEYVVQVASYVGAAGLGGVIGNRADASTVAAARALFRSGISRWRLRRADAADEALSEQEAREVARGAALTMHWVGEDSRMEVVDSERHGDSWTVRLRHRRRGSATEIIHVTVGSGDPEHARILVVPG
ncbi:hypothetical protein OOZ19_02535 [Saccharopolyspora sp. NFXS83]|uniref:hypothetical protein n=1 Tax=Saccharopolyspora sp. NFXS83 TaxID=2993560 RepID=UPI00224A7EC6|nr:hypothetical protein [Saccharopolyspora sp. NFXS83]MCX2729107.1 hypothetical protein [Saccharopolyspora sp. NFXS83]